MLDTRESKLTVPRIEGPTLRLRPFAAYDIGLIEEASADALIPLITTIPSDFSWNAGLEYVERQHDRARSGVGYSMAIADKSQDRALGQIGLWVANQNHGRATLGYWIVPSARGERRATEALDVLSNWAFNHLPLHRLSLFIEPWNIASIRTAERSGYKNEGLLRNWEVVDGVARDMLIFARIRP